MKYTTQMDAAKKGIITPEMEIVAAKENMDVEDLREKIAKGTVVIPANKNHKSISPEGIGEGLKTKINVNLGISKDCYNIEEEMKKVEKALEMKAESIMDLSNYGKTQEFRKELIKRSTAMIGSVPIYDAIGYLEKEFQDIEEEEFLKVIENHIVDGVDFITIHAGLTREVAKSLRSMDRITKIVSRGGSLLYAWMEINDKENPIFTQFDKILDLCEEYDVTLSLGDACRPGSIHDSTDDLQIHEMIVLGQLTKRAWERNVQVMIEGPGHMTIDEIEANVILQKKICHNAPFYVLGPVVTDIAPGYDHITAAIGGAIAAGAGADFLCYVTPAEHLRLPTEEDMIEGIVATKIAAHAGDLAKGINGARERDNKMSKARYKRDWDEMFKLALYNEKAIRYREESMPEYKDTCSMCGKMCSMKTVEEVLNG
ncbi:MAG: phosphomethylpyrimidine synthase ThiC [Tissierellia bacterium]|nr:phosphomethylpyrimidine synthase ThiC [Tissierellia bacterium]